MANRRDIVDRKRAGAGVEDVAVATVSRLASTPDELAALACEPDLWRERYALLDTDELDALLRRESCLGRTGHF